MIYRKQIEQSSFTVHICANNRQLSDCVAICFQYNPTFVAWRLLQTTCCAIRPILRKAASRGPSTLVDIHVFPISVLLLYPLRVGRVIMQQYPTFCWNRSTAIKISWFFNFSRWLPSSVLDLCGTSYLEHARKVLAALYYCANFGYDRLSTFDNMEVSILCTIGSKTLKNLHSQNWCFGAIWLSKCSDKTHLSVSLRTLSHQTRKLADHFDM